MGKRERVRARKLKANAKANRERKQGRIQKKPPKAAGESVRASQGPTSPRDAVRYSAIQRILVVGDGDLSFSWGLIKHLRGSGGNIVATTYDSRSALESKYPEKAISNRDRIVAAGSRVLHGIDATKLHLCRDFLNDKASFDRVVFNFPHSGQQRVHINRKLISDFFRSASHLVRARTEGGQIHVTIKMAPPYSLWGIEDLAAEAKLSHLATLAFDQSQFPGYRHQTTLADAKTFVAANKSQAKLCKTLVFASD